MVCTDYPTATKHSDQDDPEGASVLKLGTLFQVNSPCNSLELGCLNIYSVWNISGGTVCIHQVQMLLDAEFGAKTHRYKLIAGESR
jgi:hypothetical protein